jgi:hypothetical protein
MKVRGIADGRVSLTFEHGIGRLLNQRQLLLIQCSSQYTRSELVRLADNAADRFWVEGRGDPIHDHGADGHQASRLERLDSKYMARIRQFLFVLSSTQANQKFMWLAFIPALIFWVLDGYFLWQERLYRKLYDRVRERKPEDIDFRWIRVISSVTLAAG